MIICTACKKEFELKPSTKKYTGGIDEISFKCPYCKKKYIAYFIDKNIRIKQKNINKLWEKYRQASNQKEVAETLEEINVMKANIKILIDNLKVKMLGTQ